MDEGLLKLDEASLRALFAELDPKSIARLCNKTPRLRELCSRYNLWAETRGGLFEMMNSNELASIQKHNKPSEVLAFCFSNPGTLATCDKGDFWKTMMRHHYPEEEFKDPKKAYLISTNIGFVTRFKSAKLKPFVAPYTLEKDAYLDDPDRELRGSEVRILLRGDQIMRKKVWVGIEILNGEGRSCRAYATKEDAISDYISELRSNEFGRILSVMHDDPTEEDYEILPYPRDEIEEIFDTYIGAISTEPYLPDGRAQIMFSTQTAFDKLAEMGYPHFKSNTTYQEAREIVRTFIEKHGYFAYGTNFMYPQMITREPFVQFFGVFEVNLHRRHN